MIFKICMYFRKTHRKIDVFDFFYFIELNNSTYNLKLFRLEYGVWSRLSNTYQMMIIVTALNSIFIYFSFYL